MTLSDAQNFAQIEHRKLQRMESDGNCLYRAFAFFFEGDAEKHALVRESHLHPLLLEEMDYGAFYLTLFQCSNSTLFRLLIGMGSRIEHDL